MVLIMTYSIAIKYLIIVGSLLSLYIVPNIYMSYKGFREAHFYNSGFSLFIISSIIYSMSLFGYIPFNFFTKYSMMFGSIMVIIFLGIGLADQLNTLKNKLEDLNINLEKKVIERTDELKEKNDIIQKELILAGNIYKNLIPSSFPEIEDIEFSSIFLPMDELGGDFYDFIKFKEQNLVGIFISDVSGHGVPAALISSMVKTLINTAHKESLSPSKFLTYIDNKIYGQTVGNFITAFYGVYDGNKKTLRYSGGDIAFHWLSGTMN